MTEEQQTDPVTVVAERLAAIAQQATEALLAALREAGWAPPPTHKRPELDVRAIEQRVVAYELADGALVADAAARACAGDVAPLLAELEYAWHDDGVHEQLWREACRERDEAREKARWFATQYEHFHGAAAGLAAERDALLPVVREVEQLRALFALALEWAASVPDSLMSEPAAALVAAVDAYEARVDAAGAHPEGDTDGKS